MCGYIECCTRVGSYEIRAYRKADVLPQSQMKPLILSIKYQVLNTNYQF